MNQLDNYKPKDKEVRYNPFKVTCPDLKGFLTWLKADGEAQLTEIQSNLSDYKGHRVASDKINSYVYVVKEEHLENELWYNIVIFKIRDVAELMAVTKDGKSLMLVEGDKKEKNFAFNFITIKSTGQGIYLDYKEGRAVRSALHHIINIYYHQYKKVDCKKVKKKERLKIELALTEHNFLELAESLDSIKFITYTYMGSDKSFLGGMPREKLKGINCKLRFKKDTKLSHSELVAIYKRSSCKVLSIKGNLNDAVRTLRYQKMPPLLVVEDCDITKLRSMFKEQQAIEDLASLPLLTTVRPLIDCKVEYDVL